jgi:hypothetical protein
LGQTKFSGLPKFIPMLPRPQEDRLEAMVEREAIKFWGRFERAHKAKTSRRRKWTTAAGRI